MVLAGMVLLTIGVVELVGVGRSTGSHRIGYGLFGILIVAAIVEGSFGLLLLRFRVVVSSTGITSYNIRGGVRRALRRDIAAIELRSKAWGTLTQSVSVRVPYVELKDGTGFWLDPLVGTTDARPPRPEQLAILEEIQTVLQLAP